MCRGCLIDIKENPEKSRYHCLEYMEWHQDYLLLIKDMKKLNQKILAHEKKIINKEQRKYISIFRRRLINIQKEFAKADSILNNI